MSKQKFHIEDDFIPEGLEFREEYMHAALNQYKRTKRVIVLKRAAFVLSAILILAGVTIALLKKPADDQATMQNNQPMEQNGSTSNENNTHLQNQSNQDTSSSFDLVKDEGEFYKNGQSPAVESSESTQDQSSKAVDKGDSMSSGVGLPGQLSNSDRKVQSKIAREGEVSDHLTSSGLGAQLVQKKIDNHQQTDSSPSADKAISQDTPTTEEKTGIQPIAYKSAALPSRIESLERTTGIPVAHSSPWSIFTTAGLRAWSDYGFNRSPYKADGNFSLGAAYRWSPQWSSELGSNFCTITGTANPYTVVQRAYGEGFRETTYRYFTERLYELGAGITLKYHWTNRHLLGMGWKTDYLLTADNRIETGSSTSFENLGSTGVSAKGYVQGFRSIQHALLFNYEYALGASKSIGVQYQFGLTDITKNNYFGTSMDRNSMLSVYFRIKLK